MAIDAEFQGLLWTLGIDSIFLFVCFLIYRRVRPHSRSHSHSHSRSRHDTRSQHIHIVHGPGDNNDNDNDHDSDNDNDDDETDPLITDSKHISSSSSSPTTTAPALTSTSTSSSSASASASASTSPTLWKPVRPFKLLGWVYSRFGDSLVNPTIRLYLYFSQLAIYILAAIAVIGAVILVPLYYTGDSRIAKATFLQEISASNTPIGSGRYVTVFFCAVVACVLAYYFVYAFRITIRRADPLSTAYLQRKEWLNDKSTVAAATAAAASRNHQVIKPLRTLHIMRLSRRCIEPARLRDYFNTHFQNRVESVHINQNLEELRSLVDQREELILHIGDEHTRMRTGSDADVDHVGVGAGVNDTDSSHTTITGLFSKYVCCCFRRPSLRELRQRLDIVNEAIRIERERPHLSSGHAFIVFKDTLPKPSQLRAVFSKQPDNYRELIRSHIRPSKWTFDIAPPSSDLIWANLTDTAGSQRARYLLGNAILFVGMIAVIAPVSIIDQLKPFLRSARENLAKNTTNPLATLAINYTPALVVFLINSVLLPVFIELCANFEHHYRHSERVQSIFRKNSFFLLLNTIIVPTLALNSIATFILMTTQTDYSSWNQLLGQVMFSRNGHFFVQYVIHVGWLGAGSQLLDIPQQISRRWKLYWAHTRTERVRAVQTEEFDIAYYYSVRMALLGVVLMYSMTVPVIVPVGMLSFILLYVTDRNNLDFETYTSQWRDVGGVLANAVGRYTMLYIALFQFAMASIFAVQGTEDLIGLGSAFTIALLVTLYIYFSKSCLLSPKYKWNEAQGDINVSDPLTHRSMETEHAAVAGAAGTIIDDYDYDEKLEKQLRSYDEDVIEQQL
jgi:Calcium-dependent channel, 7TM region, putative phosphate/Cytosolic domain of 10TM putative phosphate transporter/Late exocytosis, associated with Golgi transport